MSTVDVANERVSIFYACSIIGMDVPDYADFARSIKVMCPWTEIYHADNSKAFRIYPDTNSAWCFAESERYTPVKLFALHSGLSWPEAAEELLRRINYSVTLEDRWNAAVAVPEQPCSHDSLAQALSVYCTTIDPQWATKQFGEHEAEWFGKCLALLDKVDSAKAAAEWLSVSKQVMRRELTRKEVSTR